METEQIDILSLTTPLNYTKLETTKTTWIWYLKDPMGGLNDIFKQLKPSTEIPFISWNGIHKIHRGFSRMTADWINDGNKTIVIKHKKTQNELENVNNEIDKYYNEIQVQFDPANGLFAFIVDLETPSKTQKDQTKIQEDVSNSMKDFVFTKLEQSDVSGFINIEISDVKKFVLLDMITNDELISSYLSIDEILQTKKTFLTIGFHKDKKIKSDATFTFTLTQSPDKDKEGYQRVKIKGQQEIADIDNFIDVITRIFAYYKIKEQSIVDYYEGFDISLPPVEKETVKDTKVGKKYKGGTRSCPKDRKITSFDDRETAELNMIKTDTNGNTITPDQILELPENGDVDKPNKFYACVSNQDSPYPGFIMGKPIPCCFKLPQNNKVKQNTTSQNYISGKNKILSDGKIGNIPDIMAFINKFRILDKSVNNEFFRRGVENTRKSLFDCVSFAMNNGQVIDDDPLYDLEFSKYSLAKQELYDYCVTDIYNLAKDKTKNIDYRFFGAMIGEIYKVNLVVFSENDIVTPRHSHGYYKRTNYYPTIILFEQTDPTSGGVRYEIVFEVRKKIVLGVKTTDYNYLFDNTSLISKHVTSLLDEKTKFSVNDRIVQKSNFKIPNGWSLTNQCFDSYGKTRLIYITDDISGRTFGLQTSPLQPYDVPDVQSKILKPYDEESIETITNIMPLIFGPIEIETIRNTNEMSFSDGNVTITIPTKEFNSIENSPTMSNTSMSAFRDYIKQQRTSNYVIENAKWLFVKSGIDEVGDFENRIFVDKSFVYQGMTKMFSFDSGVFDKDERIIVTSTNIKIKLLYVLRNTKLRLGNKLDIYKELKFVPNFYKNITDFFDVFAQTPGDPTNVSCSSYDIYKGDNILSGLIK